MNLRSDPDLAITTWLVDEARDGAPERLVDATRRQLEQTNQRRAVWPAWRLSPMNMRIAVAAAAIVVAVVGGYLLLPRVYGPGVQPTPSPTPVASPTASPQAISREGPLTAGRYSMRPFASAPGLTISFTVPPAWGSVANFALASSGDTSIAFVMANGVYSDPCHWDVDGTGNPTRGDVAVGPSAADLASALASQTAYTSTAPIDVTFAGYSGKQLDLEMPSDIDFEACDQAADTTTGAYFLWSNSESDANNVYAQVPGERRRVRILDVDGTRILVLNLSSATTSAGDLAAAQAVLDSMEITP